MESTLNVSMATNPKAPAVKPLTAVSITYDVYEFSAPGDGDHPGKTSQQSRQKVLSFRRRGLQLQIQTSIQSECLFLHPAMYLP
jgi:hypothetical protein